MELRRWDFDISSFSSRHLSKNEKKQACFQVFESSKHRIAHENILFRIMF